MEFDVTFRTKERHNIMDIKKEISELARRIYKQETPFESVDVTYADALKLATWHANEMQRQRNGVEQLLPPKHQLTHSMLRKAA
jgi:hypothetical protein